MAASPLLAGKVAIVTGAGRGIGREEALELARHGAKLIINDVGVTVGGEGREENIRPADDVVAEIRVAGGAASASYEDVGDWAAAGRLVSQALNDFGQLDIVINNAGILRDSRIVDMNERDWDEVIRVHLKGTAAVMHHAASYWRSEALAGRPRSGAVVNTTSDTGLPGKRMGGSNYSAAKAGIASLTVVGSFELAEYGVRVNAIAPYGFTRMASVRIGVDDHPQPNEFAGFDPNNPANNAPLVAWLASDDARHVTGQIFRIVGDTIVRYVSWRPGDRITKPGGWQAAEIGPALAEHVFRSRALMGDSDPALARPRDLLVHGEGSQTAASGRS
jgi:NAD(P)-dependent dehydrogenase (short-subunit alcohol dehydrogenase family)